MRLLHTISRPYQPQNNSLIERAIGIIIEGTRVLLFRAGLPAYWWPIVGRYFAMMWNITPRWFNRLAKFVSPWFLHFGQSFQGLKACLGQMAYFRSMKPVLDKLPKMQERGIPGIFLGWDLEPGYVIKDTYIVAAVASFKQGALKKIRIQYVKEMVLPATELFFPLKDEYQRQQLQITCVHDSEPDDETKDDNDESLEKDKTQDVLPLSTPETPSHAQIDTLIVESTPQASPSELVPSKVEPDPKPLPPGAT